MTCYSDEVAADSAALYWPLDDTDGPSVVDASGNARDGRFGTRALVANNFLQNSTTAGPLSLAAAVLDGSGELAINITTPSPLQTGDIRYVAIVCIGGTSVDLASGASVIDERDVNGVFCGLYEEIVTAGSTATYTVHGPAGAQALWAAWRFFADSGRSAFLTRANFTASTTETAVTDHDIPAQTVTGRWAVLVNVVMGRMYDPQLTDPLVLPPAGMTDRSPQFPGDGNPFVGLAHEGVYHDGGGDTGIRTWTLTGQNAADFPANPPASMDVYGVSLLLEPTPVPGPELNDREVTGCDSSSCPPITVPFFARHDGLPGEYVEVANPLDGLNDWTAEIWAWADPSMVSIGRVWVIGDLDLRVDPTIEAGKLRITLQKGSSWTPDTMARVGCWNHFAVVSDATGGDSHLYLNGIELLDGSLPIGSALTLSGALARIGLRLDGSSSFRGDLGHFALYDAPLSAARIAARTAYACGMCREPKPWNVGSIAI